MRKATLVVNLSSKGRWTMAVRQQTMQNEISFRLIVIGWILII